MIFQSQAGTGKTCAFALAMLLRVDASKHYVQAICTAPVFDLCQQIASDIRSLGKVVTLSIPRALACASLSALCPVLLAYRC
jgi:ATP-dependent RNA helicase DDX19/DBP5